MSINRFGQISQYVHLLAPIQITNTPTNTALINCQAAHRVTFLIALGVLTTSSTSLPAITVLAASAAATTGAAAIAFNYRLSGAVATDTWGAITAVAATGITTGLGWSDDNKILLIDVDPSNVYNAVAAGGKYAYVHVVPSVAGSSAFNLAVIGEIEPRFAGNTMVSSS